MDGQRLFRHLAVAAEAWDEMGRPDSELYRGARLARTWSGASARAELNHDRDRLPEGVRERWSTSELRASEERVRRERRATDGSTARWRGSRCSSRLAWSPGVWPCATPTDAQDQQERRPASSPRGRGRPGERPGDWTSEVLATSLLRAAGCPAPRRLGGQVWENLDEPRSPGPARSPGRQATGADGSDMAVAVAASSDGAWWRRATDVDGVQLYDARTLETVAFGDDTPAAWSGSRRTAGCWPLR